MNLKLTLSALALASTAFAAQAQEVTLRVHHFMSAKAPLHSQFLVPFAERIKEASDGRIEVQVFDSMSLGGGPPDLFDQASDGAVDAVLTLPGYTPGRFNHTEVFELPFIMEDSVATSKAFWDLVESDLQDGEFADVKVLAAWVHGPGVIHTAEPVETLEDLAGKDLRGPTRLVTDLLGELGANPVGMPLPAIPENLSKGVINGTVIPWEVTPSIRLAELVTNHTEIGGSKALYTAAFVLAMNWDSYEGLPDDLRAILDAETGKALSATAGEVMVGADAFGRSLAEKAGNTLITLDEAEVSRWIDAAAPVWTRFVERAGGEGIDGDALIEQAQGLIAANQ
ncbi:TRAP transporter substrate-binding protein [Pseudoruegeria sp. SHC-113]|uniref:TRAP transporter substrate-binding protein n=1 Tax=Pseudoruegeria sp. SHC-113 TaxID=2855439 RepID=UPI0021BA7F11|nr:TRAP transporter substrate-binding protein [Pseudoruegeria sp. SHC-113]MCT8162136.1 TRAP transporter substrate-binding protein [Pseudoruegeria sp. SHC-113]